MRLRCLVAGSFVFAVAAFGQPTPRGLAIPEIKVKYICEKTGRYWISYGKNSDNRHYCWDGTHYSRAEGGVPSFVIDYWKRKDEESAQIRREMEEKSAELSAKVAADRSRLDAERRAAGLPTHAEIRNNPQLARTLRTRSTQGVSSTTVEISQRPKAQPVQRALFDEVRAGIDRAAVVEKLGEPHGQIGNLGSDGDEESLTYLLVGGGQANVRLKSGQVVGVRLP